MAGTIIAHDFSKYNQRKETQNTEALTVIIHSFTKNNSNSTKFVLLLFLNCL